MEFFRKWRAFTVIHSNENLGRTLTIDPGLYLDLRAVGQHFIVAENL
jgi:hypothetical protein